MGMTIDKYLKETNTVLITKDAFEEMKNIMRKYQKIEDIYYHQTGRALEDSLREVIENGNVD